MIIASRSGAVYFSHYFEAIPIQFRVSFEKENVDRFLSSVFVGEKEIVTHTEKTFIISRCEKALVIILVADSSFDEMIAVDFLHTFVLIIGKYLRIVTDKQLLQKKEIIHQILEEMITHGRIVETRLNHISALSGYKMQESE